MFLFILTLISNYCDFNVNLLEPNKKNILFSNFQEILKAESWLDVCHRPFPNIQLGLPVIADGNCRTIECYIFENKDEPECPIVMHFVLINNEFKEKKLDSDNRSKLFLSNLNW